MGPVIVVGGVGGVLAAGIATKVSVQKLKSQINQVIQEHQNDIDKIKAIQNLLKDIQVGKILKSLHDLNKQGFNNLKDFFIQIENQLKILKKFQDKETQKEEMESILAWISYLADIALTLISLAPLFTGAPPVAVVMAVIGAILTIVFTAVQIYQNIQQIQQLSKKKEEVEHYFSSGGEFEKNQQKLLDCSVEITKSIYFCSIFARQLFGQYYARLHLLSCGQMEGSTKIDFKNFQTILNMNPFTWATEQVIRECHKRTKEIVNSGQSLSSKVSSVYNVIDICLKKERVISKIAQLDKAIELLSQKGSVIDQINQRYQLFRKINSIREDVEEKFKERLQQTEDQRKVGDISILDYITMFTDKLPQKELRTAQIVSFFTQKFYGDDHNGDTLYSYSLKQMAKTTLELNKIKIVSENHIFLPEPKTEDQLKFWSANKNVLIDMFKTTKQGVKIEAFNGMFMRMNQEVNEEEKINELKVYIGVVLKIEGQTYQQRFQIPFEKLMDTRWGSDRKRFEQEWKTVQGKIWGKESQNPRGIITGGVRPLIVSANIFGMQFFQAPHREGEQSAMNIQEHLFPGLKLFFPEKYYKMSDRQKKIMMLSSILEQTVGQVSSNVLVGSNQQLSHNSQTRISQTLQVLIEKVSLLVNGVAYPQRLTRISISTKGAEYEAKVEWSEQTINQGRIGKLLKGIVNQSGEYRPAKEGTQLFDVQKVEEHLFVHWLLE